MITIKENENNFNEFNELYNAVGWGAYDSKIASVSMKNTFYSISIYEKNEIIGYGRIIGDGICFLYLCDIMVKPAYQGQKIGTQIMNALLDKIKDVKNINPSVRVYLGASLGKEDFYKRFGFQTRKEAGLGEGMVLL